MIFFNIYKKIINYLKSVFLELEINNFKKKHLFNPKNLETSNSKINLIITDIQGAIGDQIISLDLISRIFNFSKNKNNFKIMISKNFKNFFERNMSTYNMQFFYLNNSLGTHVDIKNNKYNFRNIKEIAKEFANFDFDKIFVLTRLIPIDIAIFLSSVKCNKIYKFYDEHNKSTNNDVFNELSLKKLSHEIYERLKEKIVVEKINSNLHFLFNSINVFERIWNEKIIPNNPKPYEFINIKYPITLTKKKNCIFFCINRRSSKFLNFKIIKKSFELLSENNDVNYIFVSHETNRNFKKLKKDLKNSSLNFSIHNKLEINEIVKLMFMSDFVLCHDSWDYHMSKMLKKKKIIILNKKDWIVKNSYDYWINYGDKLVSIMLESDYFNNKSEKVDFYISELISKKIEEIL